MPIMLERERARRAWDRIREVSQKQDEVQKRYRSQVRGGAAMIQRGGLGQFLAFLATSGFTAGQLTPAGKEARDHADGLLYQHLGAWLMREVGGQSNEPAPD